MSNPRRHYSWRRRWRRHAGGADQRNRSAPCHDGCIPLGNLASEGNNSVEILFENLGCPNFGPVIELRQGITQINLIPESARPSPVEGWRIKMVQSESMDLPELKADFADHAWRPVSLKEKSAQIPQGKTAVYRATLSLTKQHIDAGARASHLARSTTVGHFT